MVATVAAASAMSVGVVQGIDLQGMPGHGAGAMVAIVSAELALDLIRHLDVFAGAVAGGQGAGGGLGRPGRGELAKPTAGIHIRVGGIEDAHGKTPALIVKAAFFRGHKPDEATGALVDARQDAGAEEALIVAAEPVPPGGVVGGFEIRDGVETVGRLRGALGAY
jgi:hypothetical protein